MKIQVGTKLYQVSDDRVCAEYVCERLVFPNSATERDKDYWYFVHYSGTCSKVHMVHGSEVGKGWATSYGESVKLSFELVKKAAERSVSGFEYAYEDHLEE